MTESTTLDRNVFNLALGKQQESNQPFGYRVWCTCLHACIHIMACAFTTHMHIHAHYICHTLNTQKNHLFQYLYSLNTFTKETGSPNVKPVLGHGKYV